MGQVFVPSRDKKYYIISPHEDFEPIFGRTADRRRKLYNGMMKCQLFMYFRLFIASAAKQPPFLKGRLFFLVGKISYRVNELWRVTWHPMFTATGRPAIWVP